MWPSRSATSERSIDGSSSESIEPINDRRYRVTSVWNRRGSSRVDLKQLIDRDTTRRRRWIASTRRRRPSPPASSRNRVDFIVVDLGRSPRIELTRRATTSMYRIPLPSAAVAGSGPAHRCDRRCDSTRLHASMTDIITSCPPDVCMCRSCRSRSLSPLRSFSSRTPTAAFGPPQRATRQQHRVRDAHLTSRHVDTHRNGCWPVDFDVDSHGSTAASSRLTMVSTTTDDDTAVDATIRSDDQTDTEDSQPAAEWRSAHRVHIVAVWRADDDASLNSLLLCYWLSLYQIPASHSRCNWVRKRMMCISS
jgi:hypothetical protein